MNSIPEILDELQSKAQHDPGIREKLLLTRKQPEPRRRFAEPAGNWAMRFILWS